IEIVRGPRAARWGSDAIGGVIQIFTRRPGGPAASVRYGSNDDRRASFSWGRPGDAPLDFALSARKVDGFSAQNARGFSFNPDDDGFENLGASAGGELSLAGGQLSWRGRVAHGETEFDQGVSDFTNGSLRIDYQGPVADPVRWRMGVATLRDRLETTSAFGINEVTTRRLQADALIEGDLAPTHQWLLGVDAWRESGVSDGQWDRTRTHFGVFTGLEGRRGPAGYELSLRLDEDDNFGTEFSGNAGFHWRFNPRLRGYATLGRGFRAPNFSQLFSPGFGGLFGGNPDLEPERSWSIESGLDWIPVPGQRLTVSLFSNQVDDLIDFSGENFRAINIREARTRGLEVEHQWRADGWNSRFNLTWQNPRDQDRDRDLLRRPELKGQWTLGHVWNAGHYADAELVHTGDRLDVGGVRLASTTLINLRAAVRLGRGWQAEVRLDNLFDRRYEPLVGFNAPDRTIQFGLRWDATTAR
ncbi:MAG: TonB-dependent receptor, partial [Wenzhouxiangellaceae bacterium]